MSKDSCSISSTRTGEPHSAELLRLPTRRTDSGCCEGATHIPSSIRRIRQYRIGAVIAAENLAPFSGSVGVVHEKRSVCRSRQLPEYGRSLLDLPCRQRWVDGGAEHRVQ